MVIKFWENLEERVISTNEEINKKLKNCVNSNRYDKKVIKNSCKAKHKIIAILPPQLLFFVTLR